MRTARILLGGAILAVTGLLVFNLVKAPFPDLMQTIPKVNSESLNDLKLESWHEFSPSSGAFQVLLPTLPQHVTKTFSNPTTKDVREYDMFVSEKDNGTIFMISQINFVEMNSAKLDETMLHSVVDDMLSANPDNKLKSLKNSYVAQHPALEFIIENGQVIVDGRTFIINKTLFLLTSVAKQELYKPKESQFFFNSFSMAKAKLPTAEHVKADALKTPNNPKESK